MAIVTIAVICSELRSMTVTVIIAVICSELRSMTDTVIIALICSEILSMTATDLSSLSSPELRAWPIRYHHCYCLFEIPQYRVLVFRFALVCCVDVAKTDSASPYLRVSLCGWSCRRSLHFLVYSIMLTLNQALLLAVCSPLSVIMYLHATN